MKNKKKQAAKLKRDIKEALREVKLIQEKKIKKQTLKEFLDQL